VTREKERGEMMIDAKSMGEALSQFIRRAEKDFCCWRASVYGRFWWWI